MSPFFSLFLFFVITTHTRSFPTSQYDHLFVRTEQDDIFPDTAAPIAAHTADEWVGGSSKDPVLMSLDPSKAGSSPVATGKAFKVKSVATLEKRVAYLEGLLNGANISFDEA